MGAHQAAWDQLSTNGSLTDGDIEIRGQLSNTTLRGRIKTICVTDTRVIITTHWTAQWVGGPRPRWQKYDIGGTFSLNREDAITILVGRSGRVTFNTAQTTAVLYPRGDDEQLDETEVHDLISYELVTRDSNLHNLQLMAETLAQQGATVEIRRPDGTIVETPNRARAEV